MDWEEYKKTIKPLSSKNKARKNISYNFSYEEYEAARTLDLHGYGLQTAYNLTISFIKHCKKESIKTAIIITGRGEAISKEFEIWLENPAISDLVKSYNIIERSKGGAYRLNIRL